MHSQTCLHCTDLAVPHLYHALACLYYLEKKSNSRGEKSNRVEYLPARRQVLSLKWLIQADLLYCMIQNPNFSLCCFEVAVVSL